VQYYGSARDEEDTAMEMLSYETRYILPDPPTELKLELAVVHMDTDGFVYGQPVTRG